MAKKFYKENIQSIPAILYVEEGSEPTGWLEITDPDEIKRETKKLYIQRSNDGKALYESIRADLAGMYNSGDLTIADAHSIEIKLINAKSFLITGDWATAQYEMSLITVGGAYTQELNDDITGQINNYIILNY